MKRVGELFKFCLRWNGSLVRDQGHSDASVCKTLYLLISIGSTCLNTKEFHEYTCISYSLRDIYELLSGTCFYIFKRESICVNPRQYVQENVLLVTVNGGIY